MSYDEIKATIPALWFGPKGDGPSDLNIEVHHFTESDPEFKGIPPALGLRVLAQSDGLVMGNVAPVLGGGFFMHREQVGALHRALGVWLAKTEDKQETP